MIPSSGPRKNFKRDVRQTLEVFLRFNHRYWFHENSNQVQASDFFKYWSRELDSVALYAEVREEARDINEYLDADRMRKQTDNAMRLTVVSSCGMVGTVATGFLGMNLYSHSDLPISYKAIIFFVVFVPTTMLALTRSVTAFRPERRAGVGVCYFPTLGKSGCFDGCAS